MKNILLIEPDYKNKYPPLGLMKISTYHRRKGDNVVFFKGCSRDLKEKIWDRIYITTLFTFYWEKTIKTIKFYSKSVKKVTDMFVGGIMATLMKDEIEAETGVTVVTGLLNKKGKIGYNDDSKIDSILPDYEIIDINSNKILDYLYPENDSYLIYATRGCIRKCKFCAVQFLEPEFENGISIIKQIEKVKNRYGEKRKLLFLDNNILASEEFPKIIHDIKKSGFEKGAKLVRYKNEKKVYLNRYVDFNQGLDARLITEDNMRLLGEIALNPIRIAFDDIKLKKIYINKVKLAAKYGIRNLSNYILFNYKDTPEDFYERLRINVEINSEFGGNCSDSYIWSFPMKYSPILGKFSKNRKYIGRNWNKKYLRAVQCILLATHGVVGPKKDFFERAFGGNVNEFKEILMLPENYIIYRNHNQKNGNRDRLCKMIKLLESKKKQELYNIIFSNGFNNLESKTDDKKLLKILEFYKINNKLPKSKKILKNHSYQEPKLF